MPDVIKKYRETKNKVGPVCPTLVTVFGMVIPISMIAMGAVYLNDCPAERYIPIYLVVTGSFTCFFLLLRLMETWRQDEDGNSPVVLTVISFLVGLFLFAWFIAGNVWIYTLYNKYSSNPTAPNYCDNTLYLYAFWVTTVTYILIGLCILLCCGFCICLCCCCGKNREVRIQNQDQP